MTDEESSNNRYGWWGGLACGLVVILVGVVFLLRNLGIPLPFLGLHNWWALFIVVGAIPLLAQAADSYRKSGRFDQAVLHSLLSALAVLLVAAMFLMNLEWEIWWPLFVIYGGLWVMVGSRKRSSRK